MTIKPIISLSAFFVGYIVFLLIGRALSEYKIKKEEASLDCANNPAGYYKNDAINNYYKRKGA